VKKIKYPDPVDLSLFKKDGNTGHAKYGLPKEVEFCKKCVISNQRPNSAVEYQHTKESKKATINFDENGVCDACGFAEKKNESIEMFWVFNFTQNEVDPMVYLFSKSLLKYNINFNHISM